ncbi:MBL fold metallo-hydrolase [Candidatus Parcubacteria bacterium]|nr:MBL fold metallo-hydrolase [Candidatus Parcubacteria bacterium]
MMQHIKENLRWHALAALAVAAIVIWIPLFVAGEGKLTVAFLDIGQGDAIYIEAPSGAQAVVDGGPDRSLLRAIGDVMPMGDRFIDVLIVTNPDKDHFAGFIYLLDRYDVGVLILPGTHSDTEAYRELLQKADARSIRRIEARRGMEVALDGATKLRVLFPDRDTSNWKTNDGSIVAKLTYGETSVLLTGDATKLTEGIVEGEDGENLKSDILKVGHHGSRTSTGDALLSLVKPLYAVISAGKDNHYGHPHQEVLAALKKFGVETEVTAEKGTIIFTSDGKLWMHR